MNMIDREYIIKLIRDYTYKNPLKINRVGLITLKQLQKTKIIIKKCQDEYAGLCINKSIIVINEKNITNDDILMRTCIHEINHVINGIV